MMRRLILQRARRRYLAAYRQRIRTSGVFVEPVSPVALMWLHRQSANAAARQTLPAARTEAAARLIRAAEELSAEEGFVWLCDQAAVDPDAVRSAYAADVAAREARLAATSAADAELDGKIAASKAHLTEMDGQLTELFRAESRRKQDAWKEEQRLRRERGKTKDKRSPEERPPTSAG